MNLPIPTSSEVDQLIALYRDRTGVEIDGAVAHDLLARLVQFIYLTEFEPARPLRDYDANNVAPGSKRTTPTWMGVDNKPR